MWPFGKDRESSPRARRAWATTPCSRGRFHGCILRPTSRRRIEFWLLLVVLVNGFGLSRATAQVMTGSPIGGGPPGGAVEAIVLDPKDPATVYAATNWSGVRSEERRVGKKCRSR